MAKRAFHLPMDTEYVLFRVFCYMSCELRNSSTRSHRYSASWKEEADRREFAPDRPSSALSFFPQP